MLQKAGRNISAHIAEGRVYICKINGYCWVGERKWKALRAKGVYGKVYCYFCLLFCFPVCLIRGYLSLHGGDFTEQDLLKANIEACPTIEKGQGHWGETIVKSYILS